MKRAAVLVYGASGYTGRLTVEALLASGVEVVVAGRDAAKLEPLARSWGVPHRVFALDDPAAVRRGLAGSRLLLSAAGPFEATTPALVRSCLESRVHYLDLGGEVRPLKLLADLDGAARARGILLLPSVGFDVVPSDCLAAHVARALPDAEELVLGVQGSDLLSRGSALTFADHAGRPLHVVRDGELEPLRFRTPLTYLDFGRGHRLCVATSWGDLVTAPRTTGIRNVTVFFEATAIRLGGIAANQQLGPLLASPLARRWYRSVAER
ncbi:MAG: saccharopine dehydrogenase NADP-binding domain-containing protein, partial [Deltaproteobacteria bacterium]|nr:saccharopine dehydrogenase NADP-binding domain-containing protein [Deltaproteobacteria bacterium]